ncbi:hypothetical protein AC249_AIPGENE8599 [Exaiptasia diaphana]|nr:hypothetical protein AC249_AIPGENE8599 [Exaiptasia diaphana]
MFLLWLAKPQGHLYKPKEPSSYECFYLGLIVVYSSFLYFTNEVTVCIPTVMFKKIGDIAVFLQCVIIIWFSVIMLCIIWEIKADKYFCSVFNATFYKFFIQTNFISKVNFALNHNLGAYNVSDVDKFVLSCRSVGALVVKQINGEVIVKGTCFRVGPNYVISNLHVYNNIINAHQFTEGIYVDFDYTIKNGISPSCCTILKIIIGSEDLDYIIFEIGKSDDVELPKSVTSIFKIPSSVERANEGVFHFCGYPDRADQKKVNLFCPVRNPEECLVMCLKNAEQQLLQDPRRQCYDVSTFFHGSSGSPGVLLEYGALMVLHCRGFFLSDSNGSIIEQGVLMSAIVADVTNELGYDRALELFDLDEKMELD